MGLAFEWTVKAGDVLIMGGALFTGAAFLYNRGGTDATTKVILSELAKDFGEMKNQLTKFGETLGKVAVQEMQITLLMQWYNELRRGVGRITDDK